MQSCSLESSWLSVSSMQGSDSFVSHPLMSPPTRCTVKPSFTFSAYEWFFSSMKIHVLLQIAQASEVSFTLAAGEQLFSRVNSGMTFEMFSLSEATFTMNASERFFHRCGCARVSEECWPRKSYDHNFYNRMAFLLCGFACDKQDY